MPVRFVFLTDSHHYPDAPKDFGPPKMLTRSRMVMEAAIPRINALEPDFIVHGGDLLCGGGSFEIPRPTYQRSIEEVAGVFAGFQAPIYYVPGNHDSDPENGSFTALARRFPIPRILDVAEVAPRLRLALANVYQCNPIEQAQGVWNEDLDRELRRAASRALDEQCALLLVLHPWVLPNYEPESHALVGHADRLLATVKEHPAIVAVFTGHRHRNRIQMYRDILIIDTTCLIGFPMGFREILLQDDGYLVARFHQLDLPELIQESFDRSGVAENNAWQGEIYDRDTEILLPRLKEIWS